MSLLIDKNLKVILALVCTNTILACEPPKPKPLNQAELTAGMSAGEVAGITTDEMGGNSVQDMAGNEAGTPAGEACRESLRRFREG